MIMMICFECTLKTWKRIESTHSSKSQWHCDGWSKNFLSVCDGWFYSQGAQWSVIVLGGSVLLDEINIGIGRLRSWEPSQMWVTEGWLMRKADASAEDSQAGGIQPFLPSFWNWDIRFPRPDSLLALDWNHNVGSSGSPACRLTLQIFGTGHPPYLYESIPYSTSLLWKTLIQHLLWIPR